MEGDCHLADGYDGTVAAGTTLVQVNAAGNTIGPNGGYAPFTLNTSEWDRDMRITWTFTPTGRAPVSKSVTFHTLPGPDSDVDGVADAVDACPATSGSLPNGCQPALVPDSDGDGVFGAADLCPALDGKSALNGCPDGVVPTPTATPTLTPTPTPVPKMEPATLTSGVAAKWSVSGSSLTLKTLSLTRLPSGWSAQIRCAGTQCPAKQTLEVRISAPNFTTKSCGWC